ncbi:MAG: phosphotransferase family protein [Rhodobacteraceae bacterium]|nr:phosphotransferase family protein [Paracoccaceae bacterium]
MDKENALARLRDLTLWHGQIKVEPLGGGLTNLNFVVSDDSGRYVARFGEDLPEHQLLRFNELAAARAAHAAGISPAVIHAEDGLSVIDFIDARTYDEPDIRAPGALERIIPLMQKCHREVPRHLRGPALIFWVFHVIHDYCATLDEGGSSYKTTLPEFLQISSTLEAAAGPFDIVFGHNDFLAANILDDGARLWLIDWDYAGFNTPLFDLGGLASNNGLEETAERHMLELYFDAALTGDLWHRYHAMKCASLMRETMWSMVSEPTSKLDIDYAAYTAENLTRFRRAYADYQNT